MANNHFQIAFEVPIDDPQAAITVIAAEWERCEDLAGEGVDFESPIFDGIQEFYGFPHLEVTTVARAPLTADEEAEPRPGLYIGGEDEEPITAVCQWLLGQPGVPDEIEYTWATWCDKPRPDNFGGGSIKVTKRGVFALYPGQSASQLVEYAVAGQPGERTGLPLPQLIEARAANRFVDAEQGGDEAELDILRDIADLATWEGS